MPCKMDITPNYRLAIVLSDDVERETVPRGDATMAMLIIEHAAVYEDADVHIAVVAGTDRAKGQGRYSAMRHRTAIAIICAGVAITAVRLMDVVVVAEIVAMPPSDVVADRQDILEIITGTTTFRHAHRTMAMADSVHTHSHRRKEIGTDHRSRECMSRCPFCPFRITLLQHFLPTTRRTRKAAHRL